MKISKYGEYIKYLKENLNDTPENYISSLLSKLKKKVESFFESSDEIDEISKVNNDERKENGGVSLKDLNVNLDSCEISKYSKINDNLKIIFSDENYRYDLIIIIDLKEALPKSEDEDFSIDDIENCHIKFKKYNSQSFDIEGELTKTIKVKDINEELLIDLKIEIDDLYDNESSGELEIETEEEEKKSDE